MDVCRICINSDNNLKPLFDTIIENTNGVRMVDFIRRITLLKISKSDELPHTICSTCITALSNSYFLIDMCINSNNRLKILKYSKDEDLNIKYSTEFIVDSNELIYYEETAHKDPVINSIANKIDKPKYETNVIDINVIDKIQDVSEINEISILDDTTGTLISITPTADEEIVNDELDNELEDNTEQISDEISDTLKVTNKRKLLSKYTCKSCGDKFSNKSTFSKHVSTHSEKKYKCEECTRSFGTLASLKNHVKVHITEEGKSFQCDVCGEKFISTHLLSLHSHKHKAVKPYSCTKCSKGCITKESLRKHMNIHQKDINKPRHICNFCQKEFVYASFLKAHLKNHNGELPFLCNLCGKGFRQSHSLTYHLRSHSGIKPYKCNVCLNTFASTGALKVHNRIHTNERPYVCDMCGRAFRQCTDMKAHRRTHFGEKRMLCTICGKKLTTTGQLTIHLRSHTGEKPFTCSHCSKGFATRGMLKKHYRIHTGEKPFTCNICHRAFNQSSTLKNHLNTHKITVVREPQMVIEEMVDGNCILVDEAMGTHYSIQTIEQYDLNHPDGNVVVLPAPVPYN